MFTRDKLLAIGTIISIIFLAGLAQGSIQVYESDLGKIKIDLPMTLSLKSGSSDNWLDLVISGSEKPIVAIRVQEPYGQDLNQYASSSGFKENRIETLTDDGHKLLYFAEPTGSQKQFTAFINYLEDKNKIVQMWTYSEVHAEGKTLATFDSDEFLNIAKSFTLINDTEFKAIKAEETKGSPGFETIFAVTCILGIFCAIRRPKKS
jgi:hypothetical protein